MLESKGCQRRASCQMTIICLFLRRLKMHRGVHFHPTMLSADCCTVILINSPLAWGGDRVYLLRSLQLTNPASLLVHSLKSRRSRVKIVSRDISNKVWNRH